MRVKCPANEPSPNFSPLNNKPRPVKISKFVCGNRTWLQCKSSNNNCRQAARVKTKWASSFCQMKKGRRRCWGCSSNCQGVNRRCKQNSTSKSCPQSWSSMRSGLYLLYPRDPNLCRNLSHSLQWFNLKVSWKWWHKINRFSLLALQNLTRIKRLKLKIRCLSFVSRLFRGGVVVIGSKVWPNISLVSKSRIFSLNPQNSSLQTYPETLNQN